MRGLEIEVVVRAVKICRHRRNKIVAVLASVSLAKFDAGDLGNRVGFVRRLERPAQQRAFRNRLRRVLGINAGAAQKEKFAHAVLVRRADDVVLNAQIIEQKFDRIIVVRLDPANFGRGENDDGRFFFGKKFRNGRFVREIKLRAIAFREIGKTLRLETPDERAADHPAMASDEDFI